MTAGHGIGCEGGTPGCWPVSPGGTAETRLHGLEPRNTRRAWRNRQLVYHLCGLRASALDQPRPVHRKPPFASLACRWFATAVINPAQFTKNGPGTSPAKAEARTSKAETNPKALKPHNSKRLLDPTGDQTHRRPVAQTGSPMPLTFRAEFGQPLTGLGPRAPQPRIDLRRIIRRPRLRRSHLPAPGSQERERP